MQGKFQQFKSFVFYAHHLQIGWTHAEIELHTHFRSGLLVRSSPSIHHFYIRATKTFDLTLGNISRFFRLLEKREVIRIRRQTFSLDGCRRRKYLRGRLNFLKYGNKKYLPFDFQYSMCFQPQNLFLNTKVQLSILLKLLDSKNWFYIVHFSFWTLKN